MSYRYAILFGVSEPLNADQAEQLAIAVDEVVMGNLGNFLGPFGYEGWQEVVSAVVSAPESSL